MGAAPARQRGVAAAAAISAGLVLPGASACVDLVDAVLVGLARLVGAFARQEPGQRVGLVRVARRLGSTPTVEQRVSRDGVHGAFLSQPAYTCTGSPLRLMNGWATPLGDRANQIVRTGRGLAQ
jgi:hypothetical protein